MLIFHGGLPRSGKSYESMVYHLIPALAKGRTVYARLNGLNYEKIASLAGISLERCQELLVHLTEEQMSGLAQIDFKIGSLIILDEAQNFWPESRDNLSPAMIKFVSEHGHKGLDIVLMGQEFKDVHKLWKNRVSQRVDFIKLDALGKGNEYSWSLYKASRPQKFNLVTKGRKKYDAKYFGTYQSFVEGAEENQLYDDKRANLFNSAIFKKWLPVYALVLLVAAYVLWNTFAGDGIAGVGGKAVKKSGSVVASAPAKKTAATPLPVSTPEKLPPDFVRDLCEKYRLRVTAMIMSKHSVTAIFEWYDDSLKVKERVNMLTLAKLGYEVMLDKDMQYATISKGKDSYIATQFPNEPDGRMSNATVDDISGHRDRQPAKLESRSVSGDVVATADGYGVLGRRGGVREPSSASK